MYNESSYISVVFAGKSSSYVGGGVGGLYELEWSELGLWWVAFLKLNRNWKWKLT